MTAIKTPRKLIEVALPLDKINAAAAREKSIRHGHPSTLHLWWARRPLAAARAVIFAQMVNDPGYERYLGRGVNKEKAAQERERLFQIIEDLVQWENTNNEAVLARARAEIWTGTLLARMPTRGEAIRALAYRLYTLCERQGWAEDARAYNDLITAWRGIEQAASEAGLHGAQRPLDL